MIPEQIWDAKDIPELGLYFGKASGSAMPLAWAHAEYIKLCRSLKNKQVFDMPHQTRERYVEEQVESNLVIWDFDTHYRSILPGKTLRIHCLTSATVRWTSDAWNTAEEIMTLYSGLGVHYADLATDRLAHGDSLEYTFFWHDAEVLEPRSYTLRVLDPAISALEEEQQQRDRIRVFLPS